MSVPRRNGKNAFREQVMAHAFHTPQPRHFEFNADDIESTAYTGGSDEPVKLIVTLHPGR